MGIKNWFVRKNSKNKNEEKSYYKPENGCKKIDTRKNF